jgi:hypothetical protein
MLLPVWNSSAECEDAGFGVERRTCLLGLITLLWACFLAFSGTGSVLYGAKLALSNSRMIPGFLFTCCLDLDLDKASDLAW